MNTAKPNELPYFHDEHGSGWAVYADRPGWLYNFGHGDVAEITARGIAKVLNDEYAIWDRRPPSSEQAGDGLAVDLAIAAQDDAIRKQFSAEARLNDLNDGLSSLVSKWEQRSNGSPCATLVCAAELEGLLQSAPAKPCDAEVDAAACETEVNVDALAQEIRRVDGAHRLGASRLAEALIPFISRLAQPQRQGRAVACYRMHDRLGPTTWASGDPSPYMLEYAAKEGNRIEYAYTEQPASAAVGDVDFTAEEVGECFDMLMEKGPRLIPVEIFAQMRAHLMLAAAPGVGS